MSTSLGDTLDDFKTYTQGAEQDEQGTGDLPTYNDVAAQSNPNSRFGRWRGWIEKRAAERYADISPEELERRRARGWNDDQSSQPDESHDSHIPATQESQSVQHHIRSSTPLHLRINADLPIPPSPPQTLDSSTISEPSLEPSLHIPEEHLPPTHLSIYHFGSRFLPHSTVPIRCILPLQCDRLLLLGTDTGLSVLNMFPAKWADEMSGVTGIIQKGPADAQARVIWKGEAVYQMSILEYESAGERTPQGVVLALVGPELDGPPSSGSLQESPRSLRMYNLASLVSLAKWAISQQVSKPIDLRRSPDWHPQETPVKKHRPTSSITKGLRNLMTETPIRARQTSFLVSPGTKRPPPTKRKDSWDIVDDLPLRWATDFTSLSSSGSRMLNSAVISYALWHEGCSRSTRRALLAVATKSNIFLYETPKGERAFHFVKDFYTPVQPRSLTFVQQSVQDTFRSPSDVGPSGTSSGNHHSRVPSDNLRTPVVATYGAQTAIFVVFDKKAGIIRIADSAVTEVEMVDSVGGISSLPSILGNGSGGSLGGTLGTRRSRASIDFAGAKDHKASWIIPSRVEIPPTQVSYSDSSVYLLTRGKTTHIVASPLPASIPATPPLYAVTWNYPPSSVTARTYLPVSNQSQEGIAEPSLQLIAMGEEGVEVHEVPFTYLTGNYKGKGKSLPELPVVQNALGETGFLTTGGHWNWFIGAPQLESLNATMSTNSIDSIESEELMSRVKAEEGVYGWWRKEWEDWRIFWLGGDMTHGSTHNPENW